MDEYITTYTDIDERREFVVRGSSARLCVHSLLVRPFPCSLGRPTACALAFPSVQPMQEALRSQGPPYLHAPSNTKEHSPNRRLARGPCVREVALPRARSPMVRSSRARAAHIRQTILKGVIPDTVFQKDHITDGTVNKSGHWRHQLP